MKLRAALIDDEKNALQLLNSKLDSIKDIEIVGTAGSVRDGLRLIRSSEFDILFLDVELVDGTGFEMLNQLPEIDFFIIFTTAYNQYAVEAFKVHAIDYLLKPINQDELMEAIKTAEMRMAEKGSDVFHKLETLLVKENHDRIPIRNKGKIAFINQEDVVMIKAHGQYSEVVTMKDSYVNSSILGNYHNLSSNFMRVHRSYIINLDMVREVFITDHMLMMANKERVSFASNYKKELLEKLGL